MKIGRQLIWTCACALALAGCSEAVDSQESDTSSWLSSDTTATPDAADTVTLFPDVGMPPPVDVKLGADAQLSDVLSDAASSDVVFDDVGLGDVPLVEDVSDVVVPDVATEDNFEEDVQNEDLDTADTSEQDTSEPEVPVDGTFILDTTEVLTTEGPIPQTGTLLITHNAVAVFPLFTSPEVKEITFMGSQTIFEVQTLLGCFGNAESMSFLSDATLNADGLIELGPGNNTLVQPIEAEGPFDSAKVLDVGTLIVGMAFDVPQNEFTYIPGSFCVGYRRSDGQWIFDFTPEDPFFGEGAALGTIAINADDVDMIAILFDKTTPVTFISYEGSNIDN